MSGETTALRKRLLYFADPMCSWCWGFAPVAAEIGRVCADRGVPVRLCVGGLRAFETRPMDERAKASIRHHWQEVAAATGQPFDYAFFTRERFVYDTEPACRAAVAMRNLLPDAALDYFAAVQHAFYAENLDVTTEDALAEVAWGFDVTPSDFAVLFRAEEVIEATRADFRLVQGLGIAGFPTVLLQEGERLSVLTAGWRPFAELEDDLRTWLAA